MRLVVVLTGARSQTTSDSLALLRRHWGWIEAIVHSELNGPWIHAVTEERLRRTEL